MYALRKQKTFSLLCVYDQTHALRDNGPGRRAERWWLPPPPPRFRLARASLPSSLVRPPRLEVSGRPSPGHGPRNLQGKPGHGDAARQEMGGMRLRRFRSSDLRHHGKQLTSPAESRKFPSPFSPLTLLRVHLCFSPHRH